jgi:glycosyltransferase involved in cell wall biosynthesis
MQTLQTYTLTGDEPLISFIITYYDIPIDMLRECIESITALSLSNHEREILLIDDGSEHSPIDDLKDYLPHLTYIRQNHQGLSVARNLGIEACKGQYIQFVDADDMLNTSVYEHCLDIMRKDDPDIVLFQLTDRKETIPPNDFKGPMEGAEFMRHYNLRASACGYLFRKRTLVNLRFTPGIVHEDEEFTPNLFLRAESVFTTEAKAYYYRRRDQSITHGDEKGQVLKRLNDTRDVLYRLSERCDTLPTADREALQRRVDQLTMDYLYNIIKQTGDVQYLEQCVEELTARELFPLPDRKYTKKYSIFRKACATPKRRKLLCKILSSRRHNDITT